MPSDDEDYARRTMMLCVAEITSAASQLAFAVLLSSSAQRVTNLAQSRAMLHASVHRLDMLMGLAEPKAEPDRKVCGPPPAPLAGKDG
jgi:hypothetical protein